MAGIVTNFKPLSVLDLITTGTRVMAKARFGPGWPGLFK